MKKILLATSALVASAAFAAADAPIISGFAEMGIKDTGNGDVQLHNDIDVTFSMSGETDGGLTFGATIDLDEVNAACSVGGDSDMTDALDECDTKASAYISGTFGTLTIGDTDGAADWATSETNIVDSLQDEMENAGRDGNGNENGQQGAGDGQVLRYDYSFGDFGVAVSMVQGDDGLGVADDIYEVGAKYSMDTGGLGLGFGLGYSDDGTDDIVSASLTASADAVSGVLFYSDNSNAAVGTNVGVGVKYTTGALTIGANYGEWDDQNIDAFGVAVNYDLGGGAVVQAGYASDIDGGTAGDQEAWSLGLAMNF